MHPCWLSHRPIIQAELKNNQKQHTKFTGYIPNPQTNKTRAQP